MTPIGRSRYPPRISPPDAYARSHHTPRSVGYVNPPLNAHLATVAGSRTYARSAAILPWGIEWVTAQVAIEDLPHRNYPVGIL